MKLVLIVSLLVFTFLPLVRSDDFFEITDVKYLQDSPAKTPLVFPQIAVRDKEGRRIQKDTFVPCLQVTVRVKDDAKAPSILAHAYFYDQNKKMMVAAAVPDVVLREQNSRYNMPPILTKDQDQVIYFAVPEEANMDGQSWGSALVVFGDAKGVDAKVYQKPADNGWGTGEGRLTDYDYPEIKLLENKNGPPIDRKPVIDSVVTEVVETGLKDHPQMSIYMHPPPGITDCSQANGVLCMTVLANNAEGVKRQLEGLDNVSDYRGLFKFAQDNKLIVICWGFGGVWNAKENWDDMTALQAQAQDEAFDKTAAAWEKGIQALIKDYHIPSSGYLLNGMSAAAQFSCRLALRKPNYFLAVHVHIPSSFDKPTPEANKILWLLTTGELEAGHERSMRFYQQCRALGYPMIYKALVGVGHDSSPIADDLGIKFFTYALSMRDQRLSSDQNAFNHTLAPVTNGQLQSWAASFTKPAFVGDVLNQEMFPLAQQDMILPGFQTPLPTKEIADAWNR